jgi:hypothetical protein
MEPTMTERRPSHYYREPQPEPSRPDARPVFERPVADRRCGTDRGLLILAMVMAWLSGFAIRGLVDWLWR